MSISGVATVYNEESTVKLFFNSYKKQRILCDELIICDGGSTDNTLSLLKELQALYPEFNLKIIRLNVRRELCLGQIALGRNAAIKEAKYENIVCFDFGCEYSSNYVFEMNRKLHDFKIVGGYFYGLNKENIYGKLYSDIMMPKRENLKEGFIPSSRSIAFKKSIWENVGRYPTKFLTGEDTRFALNILDFGYTLGYCPNIDVGWLNPDSLFDIFNKHKSYGMGKFEFNLFSVRSLFVKVCFIFLMLPISLFDKKVLVRITVYAGEIFGYYNRYLNKIS